MSLADDRRSLIHWVLLGDPLATKMPMPLVPLADRINQALIEYENAVKNKEKEKAK